MENEIHCKLPKNLKKRLEEQADEEMTSQATIVRQSIDSYCKGVEDGRTK